MIFCGKIIPFKITHSSGLLTSNVSAWNRPFVNCNLLFFSSSENAACTLSSCTFHVTLIVSHINDFNTTYFWDRRRNRAIRENVNNKFSFIPLNSSRITWPKVYEARVGVSWRQSNGRGMPPRSWSDWKSAWSWKDMTRRILLKGDINVSLYCWRFALSSF